MSLLLSPSSTGEISQHRHGSFPQFPSILIISTLEGSGIRINVSKSDDFELHPVSNEDPDRKKRSILDNPSPERMLTSCRLTTKHQPRRWFWLLSRLSKMVHGFRQRSFSCSAAVQSSHVSGAISVLTS